MIRSLLLAAAATIMCAGAQAGVTDKYETAPGLAATSDAKVICGKVHGRTYTQRHRSGSVERSLHCKKGWQSDHGLPLSAGGADDTRNLSCQPPDKLYGGWGWKSKDLIDTWAWRQICRKGADPKTIQAMFLPPSQWPKSYCRAFPEDTKHCR